MYKHVEIEYSDPSGKLSPIILRYEINDTNIAQRWASLLDYSIENYQIDDPERMYGFNDEATEKLNAINAINNCVDTINATDLGLLSVG